MATQPAAFNRLTHGDAENEILWVKNHIKSNRIFIQRSLKLNSQRHFYM